MSKKKGAVRVGQVGYRGRGRSLAKSWINVENAELVALADNVDENRQAFSKAFPGISIYDSHTEMLEKENLDILTIGTRASFRPPIIKDATDANIKGIYVEKPVADSLLEADEMINQCKNNGTLLVVGHQRRWTEQFIWIRNAIRNGAIGTPTHGYLYWSAGRLGSNGTHFLDAANFSVSSDPVEVMGTVKYGQNLEKTDVHPTLNERMMKDPGIMGSVTYSNGFRLAIDALNDVLLPFTWIFCGTGGRIDLIQNSEWEIEYWSRDNDLSHLMEPTVTIKDFYSGIGSNPITLRKPPNLAPYDEIDVVSKGYSELIDCIETGDTPSSTGDDARMALEMIVGFHHSSENDGTVVKLPLQGDHRNYKLDTH